MNSDVFKFSEAAELYVKNIDVIWAMKDQTIEDISRFGDMLLDQLPHDLGNDQLCRNTTSSGGAYYGAKINYLWIGSNEKKEWANNLVGMVAFMSPKIDSSCNEYWQNEWYKLFELIRLHRLCIKIQYSGKNAAVKTRLMSLAQNKGLGDSFDKEENGFKLSFDLDPNDLVKSASLHIVAILKAIKKAEIV